MHLLALLSILYAFTFAYADERQICVPTGTCIQKEPGGGNIDVRIVVPGANGKCPIGKKLCAQHQIATKCGYTYASNAAAQDGPAPDGAHPWLAYITNQTGYTGSGVLLDRYHVLTAAHKVYLNKNSLQNLHVYIGVHNKDSLPSAYKRNVMDIIIHPDFDPDTMRNNLAVLRLKAPIPLGYMKNVGAACLPKSNASFKNKRCMVAGWGVTEFEITTPTNYLKQVTVPIVSYKTCYQSMKSQLGDRTNLFLDKDGEICAGGEAGKDACTDDGGAPLICRNKNGKKVVAGLVIWGIKCGQPNMFGVYVDVPKYVEWINRAIRNLQA